MQVFKVHVLSTPRTNAFVVDIQDVDEGKFTWQIEKMYDDFKHLKSAMKDKFTHENPTWKSMALFPTPESLGNFLTLALSFLGDSVWSYDPMLNFLDNVSQKSFISELKFIKLSSKVEFLEKKSSDLEKSQELLLENFKVFQAKIDHYLRPGSETAPPAVAAPRLSWDSKASDATANKLSEPHLSITSMATTESVDESGQHVSQLGDEPSDCGDDNTSSLRTPVSSCEFAPTRTSIALTTVNTGSSNRDSSMPNSIYLPSELFPYLVSNGTNHPFDKVVDSMLQIIAPVELQIQHRQSVILLLKKLIRIALGSTAFEYGVQMTRCLLPDDPIKISVMLSKSLLPTWHTVLCEFLTAYAERANMYGGSSFVPPDEEEQNLDPYFHDLAPPANHFLGNVSHVKQNLMHSVTLIVDSIVVDITPNNRAELCLTSFVEDVSQVIGSNDLFKRSLLLVRAWWALEAQTYVGCSIRHYLTDFQLFVMLTGVFNQYATFIKSPMIAFCFFLAEYSGYDGISKAISIRGFAPFQTKTSNQPSLPDAKHHFVIPESLLDKYWVLFNMSHAQEQQDQQQRKRSHSSSDDEPSVSDGNSGNQNMNSPSRSGHTGDSTTENVSLHEMDEYASSWEKLLMIDAVRDSMKALSTNNLFLFDRSSYNIVHPLCHMNMITEKLSQRRVSRLVKVFQSSAVAVAAILRSSNSNAGATGTTEQFDSMCACFSNIRALNNLWNQAQLPVDLLSIMKDPFDMSMMLQIIQYSNLIIESAVNDEGLLILTQEILATKGPLPVGEIGKVLAETTSIPNLSVKLKEKYGGLKRYLELYQDRFVLSNDHPFNPNVLLRCSLAPEHLEMIDKGNFPHHIVARAKKASAAAAAARRKKTAPSLSGSVTNVDPNSFTITPSATNNNNNNVNNVSGHAASPTPNMLPLSPQMASGSGSSSVSANSGNTSSVNAFIRPLSNPSQLQQQVSPNIANLTLQQQNLVHATGHKLKNVSQPPPATVVPSSVSNNNINGTSGMSLSVAQLAQQYGGNNSTNMMNSNNYNNRPKTFPTSGSVHNNLPSGAVKLPMSGLNNSNNNNIYANNNNNANSGYYGINSGNSNNTTNTMRLGSNSYSASSVPMQQSRSLNNNNSIDISAFANAAAAHWSQHQQQQMQQPSRRSSRNSDFNDNNLSNSLSIPIGGNSCNSSNNNSNHNSLNSSNNGNGLLTGGSRDNVRVLFGNSFVSNVNSNTNNSATSTTNSFGKVTPLFDQTASPQVGFGSFLSNTSNSTNTSANNSRPTSLGQSLTVSDPTSSNMNGFGAFGVMDAKLGLDLDMLSLAAPNAQLSSLAATSSSILNNTGNNNNSNNNGSNSSNYNLW